MPGTSGCITIDGTANGAATDGCTVGMNGNDSTCHVLCDGKHPCAAGQSCTPFNSVAGAPLDATVGTCP